MISTSQFRPCDVCRLVDYNCEKKICFYCNMCDAWICQEDSNRWDRRIRAAVKRKLEAGFIGDPNYTEKINEKGELK